MHLPGTSEKSTGFTPPPDIQRVTKDVVREASNERRQAWSKTLDRIVESGRTQGDFFAQFGNNDSKGPDSRVLMFTVPYGDETGATYFYGVSQIGPVAIQFTDQDKKYNAGEIKEDPRGNGNPFYRRNKPPLPEVQEAITKAAADPQAREKAKEGGLIKAEDRPYIHLGIPDYGALHAERMEDVSIVQEVIRRSIDAAEAPHIAEYRQEMASISMAQELQAMISTLPPRK